MPDLLLQVNFHWIPRGTLRVGMGVRRHGEVNENALAAMVAKMRERPRRRQWGG